MIHTDGSPTVASAGRPDARLAAVFGMKPLIVEDAMQREIELEDAGQDFRAMNYGAWRAFTNIRESIQKAEEPLTVEGILTIIIALELTYESLYRASV